MQKLNQNSIRLIYYFSVEINYLHHGGTMYTYYTNATYNNHKESP